MNKWIPVSERLPERFGNYLVTYIIDIDEDEDGEPYNIIDVDVLYYFNDPSREYNWETHFGVYEYKTEEIIAWMPLPEPYKVESEDEG